MAPQQDAAAAARPPLSRQATLLRRLESASFQFQRRMEPMVGAAEAAMDEMSILLDPGAIDEALQKQDATEAPASPASITAGAGAQQEAKLQKLGGGLIDPAKVMLQDKMAFVLGVVNVCLTAFWVGRWPETYHYFWGVKDLVLFSLRFLLYKKQGMHYMMLEYCYTANLVAFYYLLFCPQSAVLRRFSFAIMSGPLMWSIVAMRNSLVFHDGEKVTTLMMHSSPALSAWCMRWYPRPEWTANMAPDQLADWNSASWAQMAVLPAALNLAWVTVYYLIIFVAVNKRIQQRGYQNMFTAMVTRPSARKSALAKMVLAAPQPLQPLFYLCIHTFASWLSLIPTKLWFDCYWAHTAIVCAILLVSVWNGATFYFRVFAKKLAREEAERKQAGAEAKKVE